MSNTTVPLTKAKTDLSSIVAAVVETHQRVTVTRNGVPAVVMLSPDDLASLEETIAVLSDPGTLAALAAAKDEPTLSLDEVRRALAASR